MARLINTTPQELTPRNEAEAYAGVIAMTAKAKELIDQGRVRLKASYDDAVAALDEQERIVDANHAKALEAFRHGIMAELQVIPSG